MTVSHLIDAVFPFCSSSLTPSTWRKPEEQKESVLNDSSILAVHIPLVSIASFTVNNERIKYIYTLPFKGGWKSSLDINAEVFISSEPEDHSTYL